MEIGNGIDRRKPLNAHGNLHRLLFYILHILGEICTASKFYTIGRDSRTTIIINYKRVHYPCETEGGNMIWVKILKWRFFYPLFLLQIWRCVYCLPMHLKAGLSYCFFLCLCKLQSGQVAFVLVAPGQVSPAACLVSHIC